MLIRPSGTCPLAPETLEQIRRNVRALHDQWEQVPTGSHLELVFETHSRP